eukprot:4875217-Pyramimonas_sp.AAC.1
MPPPFPILASQQLNSPTLDSARAVASPQCVGDVRSAPVLQRRCTVSSKKKPTSQPMRGAPL